ncbi:MAG: CfrBI family restriction endonuclease [Selenomonadaceae bacterium]|nr:CfrBI family restriction endonuclease [Selenomonadaceae bacterium]
MDYRQEIVNEINVRFLDFTLSFFREIVEAKLNDEPITAKRISLFIRE